MKKAILVTVILFVMVFLFFESPTYAAITITGETTGSPASVQHPGTNPLNHNCVDNLNPNTIQRLSGPSADAVTALERDFSDWNLGYNYDQEWTGTLDILDYSAHDYGQHIMGADLYATYSHEGPPIDRFRWIQIIITNDPLNGGTSPYVDPFPNDDTKPFYWMEDEFPDHDFVDKPKRFCPEPGLTTWRADLYLSDWFGPKENKTVVLYEGIRWGFDISCVPEPATMMLLGLGGMLLRKRRT